MTMLGTSVVAAIVVVAGTVAAKTVEASILAFAFISLWQVPLILAAASLLARALRSQGPAAEHKVWVVALVLQASLPGLSIVPAGMIRDVTSRLAWIWHGGYGGTGRITVIPGLGHVHGFSGIPALLLDWVVIVYGCSVACFAGRLLYRLWRTRVMRSRAQEAVWTAALARTWQSCSHQFGVTGAELAISSQVSGPMTMGVRRRVLLLPASFTTVLSAEDQTAAVAHEFAHMQRRDYAKNLLYELLSLPIAYHPLLSVTRARIAETREMVCDVMAARATAGPRLYARSLLRLASASLGAAPARNFHAIGMFDANVFERRIMSLTRKPVKPGAAYRCSLYGLCIVVGAGTCVSAAALRMDLPAAVLQSASGGATGSVSVPTDVMAANVLTRVPPVYPPRSKADGVEGSVVLNVQIGSDGRMQHVEVSSGPAELRQSALDSVETWTYKPYRLNGAPVAVTTTVTVNYSLHP